jgi:hypothetical protein
VADEVVLDTRGFLPQRRQGSKEKGGEAIGPMIPLHPLAKNRHHGHYSHRDAARTSGNWLCE